MRCQMFVINFCRVICHIGRLDVRNGLIVLNVVIFDLYMGLMILCYEKEMKLGFPNASVETWKSGVEREAMCMTWI